MKGLCPYRAIASFPISQGVALGWRLIAPSGRYRKDADNHFAFITLVQPIFTKQRKREKDSCDCWIKCFLLKARGIGESE